MSKPHVRQSQLKRARAATLRNLGSCPDCGKVRFETRRDAKADAARQVHQGRPRMRAYRCGDYWHLTSQDTATVTSYQAWGERNRSES